MAGREIELHGVGKQVRDLLDVEDLVDLFVQSAVHKRFQQRVFNVGGGIDRNLSLLEFFGELRRHGLSPKYRFGQIRPSDQLYYVSDIQEISAELSWEPRFNIEEIIQRLISYIEEELEIC